MVKDLTSSNRDRQNILNNRYAVDRIAEHLDLQGTYYEDSILFTKQQLVQLFEISDSTIEKYLAAHGEELKSNGYAVLRGKALQSFKAVYSGTVIDYGTKTTVLGVFTFRALLNVAMLLTESERAREIRSRILDIVIDVLAEKTGGHTKYINQRDPDYLPAAYRESAYHQEFTNIQDARVKMASRDLGFRDALHQKLEAYIQSVPENDFDRFLGETSKSLKEQLSDPEVMDVFKRLKDRPNRQIPIDFAVN